MADTNYWRFRPDNHHCTLELKEANLIIGQQVPAKVCAYCDDLNTAARACQRNMASVIQQVVSDEEMDGQGKEEEPELVAWMQSFVKGTVDLDRYIQLEKELKNARSSVANWKKNARNARSEKATAQATVAALLIENTELREAVDDSRTFSLKEGPHKSVPFHGMHVFALSSGPSTASSHVAPPSSHVPPLRRLLFCPPPHHLCACVGNPD
jgi:hypothetical protein